MSHRVVISGMGVVSPIGIGVKQFTAALFAGENGVDRITHFDPSSYRSQMAGEVKYFDPSRYFSSREAKHMDRFLIYFFVFNN